MLSLAKKVNHREKFKKSKRREIFSNLRFISKAKEDKREIYEHEKTPDGRKFVPSNLYLFYPLNQINTQKWSNYSTEHKTDPPENHKRSRENLTREKARKLTRPRT